MQTSHVLVISLLLYYLLFCHISLNNLYIFLPFFFLNHCPGDVKACTAASPSCPLFSFVFSYIGCILYDLGANFLSHMKLHPLLHCCSVCKPVDALCFHSTYLAILHSNMPDVCRCEVEEKVNKLKLEVEALSQSEQTAAKAQACEREQVTETCITFN